MKEDIRIIVNRMTIIDGIKKEIGEIKDIYPMDVSVDTELGDIVSTDEFIQRMMDRFQVELSKDEIPKNMTVLDLSVLIENKKNKEA